MVGPTSLLLANSLTQVMWGFLAYVVAGNLVIAAIEAAIMSLAFGVRFFRALGWMLVANLLSAWIGGFVFGIGESPTPLIEWLFPEPLYQVRAIIWVCIATGVAMTLLIEAPFYYLAMRSPGPSLVKSIKALLYAHAVTITCLCCWIGPASSNTLGRAVEVVRDLELGPDAPAGWVYYVHRDTGDVHRIRLDGASDELVMRAGVDPHRSIMWVEAWPWSEEIEHYELQLFTRSPEGREQPVEKVDALARVALFYSSTPDHPMTDPAAPGWTVSFGMATADLRDEADRAWHAFARHNNGLKIETSESDAPLAITFDTPFHTWRTHTVTALPGDLAVFDFGVQVCLLNVRTREVTALAHGVGPVVVLDSE